MNYCKEDRAMDIEQKTARYLDESEKNIKEAQNALEKMSLLRNKIHLKDGTGQRYLKKVKPSQSQLKKAEKEIIAQYSGRNTSTDQLSDKKKKLVRNTIGKNTI